MPEDKKFKNPISATDVFFFTGLGVSTFGLFEVSGPWAWVWCGVWLLLASYRAPG
jgi:hypothetical protein